MLVCVLSGECVLRWGLCDNNYLPDKLCDCTTVLSNMKLQAIKAFRSIFLDSTFLIGRMWGWNEWHRRVGEDRGEQGGLALVRLT